MILFSSLQTVPRFRKYGLKAIKRNSGGVSEVKSGTLRKTRIIQTFCNSNNFTTPHRVWIRQRWLYICSLNCSVGWSNVTNSCRTWNVFEIHQTNSNKPEHCPTRNSSSNKVVKRVEPLQNMKIQYCSLKCSSCLIKAYDNWQERIQE